MNRVDAVWAVGRCDDPAAHEALRPAAQLRRRAHSARGRRRARDEPLLVARSAGVRHVLSAHDPLPGQERDPQPLRARPADPRVRHPLRAPRRIRSRGGARDAGDRPRRATRSGSSSRARGRRAQFPAKRCPAPGWSRSRRTFRSSRRRSTAVRVWRPWNRHPVSIVWGEPMTFDGHPPLRARATARLRCSSRRRSTASGAGWSSITSRVGQRAATLP